MKSSTPKIPSYQQMLYQICQEEKINLQFLSNNWVVRLEKDGKVRFIAGYKFDLNSQATSLIADDKFATFEALSYAKVPVIQHAILYEPTDTSEHARGRNSLSYIAEFFERNHHSIIIKANHGTCGRQVYKVTHLDQLINVLPEVFKQSASASMCPFYEIAHEYRVILLDGEEKLSYMKTKQDAAWFNLDRGAKASPIPEEKYAEILDLAKRAARAIDLRFGSVDMIETRQGELLVLEINSGVMTKHYLEQYPEEYEKVKSMYREAIQKMFSVPNCP